MTESNKQLIFFRTDPLGRKRAMLIVNIPSIIAWLMTYNSTTFVEVLVAKAILGLGLGLMESPILTYIGEIWCVKRNFQKVKN